MAAVYDTYCSLYACPSEPHQQPAAQRGPRRRDRLLQDGLPHRPGVCVHVASDAASAAACLAYAPHPTQRGQGQMAY